MKYHYIKRVYSNGDYRIIKIIQNELDDTGLYYKGRIIYSSIIEEIPHNRTIYIILYDDDKFLTKKEVFMEML